MKEQPLVSVAMVAYNQGKFVQEAILSIVNQTYNNIELIIVDDGSSDDTMEKIKEMEDICKKRFVKLTIVTQPNSGSCVALTKAYKLCKGKYIYDIAADDIAKPKAIEKCASFLENHDDYGLCVSDNEIINDQSIRIGWTDNQESIDLKRAKYKSFGDFLKTNHPQIDFYSDQFGDYETFVTTNHVPNGYMLRNSIFDKIGYFTPEAPLEDWWLMLQVSKYAKMKYLDEILFSYRWHGNNTVKKQEYMRKISIKTQLYEQKLVNSMSNKKWKHIFNEKFMRIRNKINLKPIFALYSVKGIIDKRLILYILGKEFVLKKEVFCVYE